MREYRSQYVIELISDRRKKGEERSKKIDKRRRKRMENKYQYKGRIVQ
jgi:hypothetical protein